MTWFNYVCSLFGSRRDALHVLSQTDALFGLKNRGAFEAALGEEFAALQTGHGKARTALLFIDMDHFKRINDESAHAAGDAVVRAMGLALKSEIRNSEAGHCCPLRR